MDKGVAFCYIYRDMYLSESIFEVIFFINLFEEETNGYLFVDIIHQK